MTRYGPYTATGFGHAVINDPGKPNDITTVLITPGPRVVMDQRGPPFAVQHVGMVGIGCFPDDMYACDPPSVFYSTAIRWDVQVDLIPSTVEAMATISVFWKLTDGTTVTVYVDT